MNTTRAADETRIRRCLEEKGPQTGADLQEHTRIEPLSLWRQCRRSAVVISRIAGRRFLRLDRVVEGYARLSPSIRREFLTYTVLGLQPQLPDVEARARRLVEEIGAISRRKLGLARDALADVLSLLPQGQLVADKVAFVIAGDITYGMAHAVPRPESSTGEMVRGSDLDIVCVADDDLPEAAFKALDNAIYKKKHFLLKHPDYREEIDYLVKRMSAVGEQARFDTFESMVACKILCEGQLLHGSPRVFGAVKQLIEERGIPRRLEEFEQRATQTRDQAEAQLLDPAADTSEGEARHLFYTREESEEIY